MNSTKVCAARAARLYFLIYPIRSLFSGVVVAVAVAVVLAKLPNVEPKARQRISDNNTPKARHCISDTIRARNLG